MNKRNFGWLGLFACAAVSAGEVYKWVDGDGNVHFGDRPPETKHEQMNVAPKRGSSSRSSTASAPLVGDVDQGTAQLCSTAGRNFKRFTPQLESLAMAGVRGEATPEEIQELRKGFAEMRKISATEFSRECTKSYDSDPQARAMADCFGNSDDVMSASLCMASSGVDF